MAQQFDIKEWDLSREKEDIERLCIIYPSLECSLIERACEAVKAKHPGLLGSFVIGRIFCRIKPYYREFGEIVVDYL